MLSSREAIVYKCNLHRAGVFLLENIRLLKAFAVYGDFKRLSEEALKENLLGKTSAHTIKAILQAFRRRFLNPHPSLLPAALVAQAVKAALPEVAKTQILFPYYLLSDAPVADVYRGLVLPQVSRGTASWRGTRYSAFWKKRAEPTRSLRSGPTTPRCAGRGVCLLFCGISGY